MNAARAHRSSSLPPLQGQAGTNYKARGGGRPLLLLHGMAVPPPLLSFLLPPHPKCKTMYVTGEGTPAGFLPGKVCHVWGKGGEGKWPVWGGTTHTRLNGGRHSLLFLHPPPPPSSTGGGWQAGVVTHNVGNQAAGSLGRWVGKYHWEQGRTVGQQGKGRAGVGACGSQARGWVSLSNVWEAQGRGKGRGRGRAWGNQAERAWGMGWGGGSKAWEVSLGMGRHRSTPPVAVGQGPALFLGERRSTSWETKSNSSSSSR